MARRPSDRRVIRGGPTLGDSTKPRRQSRRRSPWLGSASEGFRPIKQVGVAYSIGFPLMLTGLLILFVAYAAESGGWLWYLGGGMLALGLVLAASGRVL